MTGQSGVALLFLLLQAVPFLDLLMDLLYCFKQAG